MITVIATGFDATKKREPLFGSAYEPQGASQRDYLGELERERAQTRGESGAAAPQPIPVRVERTAGEPAAVAPSRKPTYDAEDLEIPSFLRRK
jgi:hypothetical protein